MADTWTCPGCRTAHRIHLRSLSPGAPHVGPRIDCPRCHRGWLLPFRFTVAMRALPTCGVGALLSGKIALLQTFDVVVVAWHLGVGVLLAVPATLALGQVIGTALLRRLPSIPIDGEWRP